MTKEVLSPIHAFGIGEYFGPRVNDVVRVHGGVVWSENGCVGGYLV